MKKEIPKEVSDFLKGIELYYGLYDPDGTNSVLKNYVIGYLLKYNPDKYDILSMKLFETHPRSFGPPDIAALFKAADKCPADMKKDSGSNTWKIDDYVPETEQERKTAKAAHDTFIGTMTDLKIMKNQPDQKPNCNKCQFRPSGDPKTQVLFECMGCIDYSNFKMIEVKNGK